MLYLCSPSPHYYFKLVYHRHMYACVMFWCTFVNQYIFDCNEWSSIKITCYGKKGQMNIRCLFSQCYNCPLLFWLKLGCCSDSVFKKYIVPGFSLSFQSTYRYIQLYIFVLSFSTQNISKRLNMQFLATTRNLQRVSSGGLDKLLKSSSNYYSQYN